MKILIVDDEYYTVAMLCEQIDWKILGIDTVLNAYNGRDALALIEKEHPEIVVCDIEMPQMSGLDVQKAAAEEEIHSHFLFLTSFEKFEYVRDAMHYGAADYLTKPFEVSDIFTAISRQVQEVRKEQSVQKREHYWEKNRAQIAQHTLRKVLEAQNPEKGEIRHLLNENGISADPDGACRIILALMPIGEQEEDSVLLQFVLENMVSEIVCGNLTFQQVLPMRMEMYRAAAAFRTASDESLNKDLQMLSNLADKYFGRKLTCLVSDAVPLWRAGEEWQHILTYMQHQIVRSGIFYVDDTEGSEQKEGYSLNLKKISRWLETKQKENIVQYLGTELNHLQMERQLTTEVLLHIGADIEQEIYSFLKQRGIQAHMLYRNERAERLRRRAEKSPFHMTQWVDYLCQSAFDELEHVSDKNSVVREITDFIRQHYKEKITRKKIAEQVYLTPNYVSKLFHDKTGMTIPDYINQVRIEAAKDLMLHSSWTIGEIALEVGFESMAYFSTTFRKICGVTPAQWRSAQ